MLCRTNSNLSLEESGACLGQGLVGGEELGETGPGSRYLSIPARERIPTSLACQEGPKKIPGRESQAPTASSGGDNVRQSTAATARALLGPRYFCHLAHTPQMGRNCLTFQSSETGGERDLPCLLTKCHSPSVHSSRI